MSEDCKHFIVYVAGELTDAKPFRKCFTSTEAYGLMRDIRRLVNSYRALQGKEPLWAHLKE